jgi:hypothetical protein
MNEKFEFKRDLKVIKWANVNGIDAKAAEAKGEFALADVTAHRNCYKQFYDYIGTLKQKF